MGHLVRLIVGDWSMLGQGTWKFNNDHTEVKYDVVLKENQTYESLEEMVRKKYQVFPSEPLLLTYDYPDMMKIPGDYTTPPVEIIEDGDVELFLAVRMDFVNLAMCVTYGNEGVGHYRTMRREEFDLTEDGTDMHPPKPRPWRGFPVGGYLQISEEMLLTICSKEQVNAIRRNVVRLTRSEISQPREDIPGIRSESDSSDEMDDFTPDGEGIIRLQEEAPTQLEGVNLKLAIAGPAAVKENSMVVLDKGKGKMYEPSVIRNLLMDFQIGSGSGNEEHNEGNGKEANYEVDDCDILEGEPVISNNHLFVGQVFVDREAFKVHMSLYALANKYSYYVKRSEPGKVVLQSTASPSDISTTFSLTGFSLGSFSFCFLSNLMRVRSFPISPPLNISLQNLNPASKRSTI